MKKFGYLLLAWFCPWFVFLMHGEPGRAFLVFMLQASFLGWPFVSVWAWRVLKEEELSTPSDASKIQSASLNQRDQKR